MPLPRPAGLGLIEAAGDPGPIPPHLKLPRPAGLGLIEAVGSGVERGRPRGFRGLLASASLKLVGAGLQGVAPHLLPRPAGLGLIEARRDGISGAMVSSTLPRPAGLGLIEAR